MDGLEAMQETIRIVNETNSILAMRFVYAKLAEYLAISGDWEQAQLMDEKASACGRQGQKWGEIVQHRARSFIATAKSPPDWSEVDRQMTKSIQLAEANKNLPELMVSFKRYGELLDRKGDRTRAQTSAAKAEDLGRRIGYRFY